MQFVSNITDALYYIHQSDAIHRDLHSGNILFSQLNQSFNISDLGFCGPADKPLNSIYGNLPYIAPEVIAGRGTTFASDIYSISMIMWEISSGQPPSINYENDYDLAMKIINGMRPKIVPETPLEYKELMEQCCDADPLKRPDINSLAGKINEMNFHYQNTSSELTQSTQQKVSNDLKTSSKLLTSKVHQFENMPEPKNATEGITSLITYYH